MEVYPSGEGARFVLMQTLLCCCFSPYIVICSIQRLHTVCNGTYSQLRLSEKTGAREATEGTYPQLSELG